MGTSYGFKLVCTLSTSFAVLRVEEVLINRTNGRISLIKGENASITIPREVIANVEGRESIQVVSILYQNMSGLLPESLDGVEVNDG